MTGRSITREHSIPPASALARPVALAAASFGIVQGYLFVAARLGTVEVLLGALAVPLAMFGLFLLWTRWDGRPLASYGFSFPRPAATALALAGGLVGVQTIVLLEPGLGLGFARTPAVAPLGLGFTAALDLLTALATVAVFQGYVLQRLLVPGRFPAALAISSAGFALCTTNVWVLPILGSVELGVYLLTITLTAFVAGLVGGLYFYKSGRNALGPFVFRAGTLLVAALSPIVAFTTGWELTFLVELLAYGAVLFLVLTLLREPKLLARAYLGESFGPKRDRYLGTLRRAHRLRDGAIAAGIAAVVLLGTIGAVEDGLGTSHPLLAIETGSMAPTLVRGTLVVVAHAAPSQIQVGTIIAYSSTCLPSPVVHRVVAVTSGPNGTTYTTKGDANPATDRCPVSYGAVLGRVVAIAPVLGFFVLAPQLTVGVAALGVVAGMLFWPGDSGRFPHRGWAR